MRGNELLDKMELIDPAYIEAADTAPNKRKSVWAKWGTLAACLCLVCVLAVPAMAAFSPAFYELLYAVTPATAQFFKPVQRSCEDNGIRMEVTAAYIHENTAEIYLSLEDLTGTSFDETVDLFDSYRLHTPFDCTGHCQLASYDPDTHTATFLVTLEQWDRQSIEGEKLTFSVQKLLSGKKTWEGTLDGVDLGGSLTSATQTVQPGSERGPVRLRRRKKRDGAETGRRDRISRGRRDPDGDRLCGRMAPCAGVLRGHPQNGQPRLYFSGKPGDWRAN